jgi:hypothetical protein
MMKKKAISLINIKHNAHVLSENVMKEHLNNLAIILAFEMDSSSVRASISSVIKPLIPKYIVMETLQDKGLSKDGAGMF